MILLKRKIKICVAIATIIISSAIIYNKKTLYSNIALVSKDKSQIKYLKGSDVTEIVCNDGENEQRQNIIQKEDEVFLKDEQKIDLNLIDMASPNNVETINTKVLEDNMIINFEKPGDNGTNYEYQIKTNDNEKNMKFYAKTGIKGYNYIVDNSEQTQAEEYINKYDDGSILVENLNWDEDYFLHIRTFDENKNCSESKTFKLYLPSGGVTVNYIDINSNKKINPSEHFEGNAKERYDVSNLEKAIDGYQFIETEGEKNGTLSKDIISVNYNYAKNAIAKIKYIDEETQEEIAEPELIHGYEGKEISINAKPIYGYKQESSNSLEKMQDGENIINLYYKKIPKGTVNIKYIDNETNNEILESETITKNFGETYFIKAKEIDNYELSQSQKEIEGVICENTKEIIYYYTKKKEEENKYMNEEDEKNASLIDELIDELDLDSSSKINQNKKQKIDADYQIVMDCSDSDYIIYYKVNRN